MSTALMKRESDKTASQRLPWWTNAHHRLTSKTRLGQRCSEITSLPPAHFIIITLSFILEDNFKYSQTFRKPCAHFLSESFSLWNLSQSSFIFYVLDFTHIPINSLKRWRTVKGFGLRKHFFFSFRSAYWINECHPLFLLVAAHTLSLMDDLWQQLWIRKRFKHISIYKINEYVCVCQKMHAFFCIIIHIHFWKMKC